MATEGVTSFSREPEDVIISRNGAVLGKKTVLKSDHFPGCQNKRLVPQVDGAPNYRQVGDLPVYGVAIPTLEGIRNVLHLVGASKSGGRHVVWHNMREEPVLYINGRPFVLREVERPFSNLEYTGIDRARVEQMEARLKEDVCKEADRYGKAIMVSDELPDGQMVDQWEPIGPGSAVTPLEVYQTLEAEGYAVHYERVPVTDEKSPKERDFDLLVTNLSQVPHSTAQIFNCQMGRGRTTTGMVIATLLHLRRSGHTLPPLHRFLSQGGEEAGDPEAVLKRGEYAVIRSLTRVLEGGADGKRRVDAVIDRCSAMQNLREAILSYRNAIRGQADEKKRQQALANFVEYLERYYFLIAFSVYLHTDEGALAPREAGGRGSFQVWMKEKPELYSVLRRLLRRNPMGALGHGEGEGGALTSPRQGKDVGAVVGSRSGEVLGRQTVLKSDHYPGCQNADLLEHIPGAPNFRQVTGFPFHVYGTANPTVEGMKAVLRRAGGGVGRKVVWHNMREETMVFINGQPFVLRELERPFKNMLEYRGIECERVEGMEARLKEDVVREAGLYSGSILVNHESPSGEITDVWESVDVVQTPLEVYHSLQQEGYRVEYARVPITDGKAPKNRDFDSIARRVADAGPEAAFVFNCQMGRGRTTTGTVIACLVLTRCMFGSPLQLPPPQPLHPLPPHRPTDSDSSDDSPSRRAKVRRLEAVTATATATATAIATVGDDGGGECGPDSSLQNAHNRSSALSIDGQQILSRYGSGSFGGEDSFVPWGGGGIDEGQGEGKAVGQKSRLGRGRQQSMLHFKMDDISLVRRVTRLLTRGKEVRECVDAVIDRCASMQNIRKAILTYRRAFNNQDEDARVRQSALSRGMEYLERYVMLIAFSAYLESDAFRCAQGQLPFKLWLRRRPEIRQMKWSLRLRPARVFTIPEGELRSADAEGGGGGAGDGVQEAVVRSRSGAVLSRSTILKLYLLPALAQATPAALSFQGAPNVCGVEGFPVHSMATPTVAGARAVLNHLGAGPGADQGVAVVTDLREEAVVYICGKPYVLREVDQPVSTLKHVGIQGPVVEQLEARMKADIVAEVAQMGGRILLHSESGEAEVSGFWETVAEGDVKTPSEVYAELAGEGFRVEYKRIPLTREREPRPSDIDAVQRRMDGAPPQAEYLFVSHTGYGGVAYAMAIICLRTLADRKRESTATPFSTPPMSPPTITLSTPPRSHRSPFPCRTPPPLGSPPSPRTSMRGIRPPSSHRVVVAVEPHKGAEQQRQAMQRGEYRDILSLERVLVHGPDSKFEVDEVADRLVRAGRIRDDILAQKESAEGWRGEGEEDKERQAACADMAIKALRRYCYLIMFRAYLYSRVAEAGNTTAGQAAFAKWMEARPELGYIFTHLRTE